jgi:hypothetical protein
MPSLGSSSAVFVVAVGLAGVWGHALTGRTTREGPVLPVAALAWAQANCDPSLKTRPGTPRVQAEDLMRIAAKYDAERTAHGFARACWLAQRAAESAVDRPGTSTAMRLLSVLASLR